MYTRKTDCKIISKVSVGLRRGNNLSAINKLSQIYEHEHEIYIDNQR